MATTQKGIYYPDDYTAVADVPEDMKDLAESVDTALGNLEDNIKQNIQPQIDNINEEQTTQNNNIEALQTENTRLKATLPTTTGEGENITLSKTAELEFIQPPLPRGNSEQDGEPTPTTPIAISNVTGDVEVLVQNKNYFDRTKMPNAQNWPTFTNGKQLFIKVKPNTEYTLSSNVPRSSNNLLYFNGTSTEANGVYNGKSVTQTSDNEGNIYVGFFTSRDYYNDVVNGTYYIQLEEGTTATTYTPHQEQTLPLTLGNIELCKIGDYQDYFYKENSKWYMYKAVGKLQISENVFGSYSEAQNTDYIYCYSTIYDELVANSFAGLSSHFINHGRNIARYTNEGYSLYSFGGSEWAKLRFMINKDLLEDTSSTSAIGQSLNKLFSEKQPIFLYPLVAPTITEITDTTLINQLEAISNATSYNEQTNISGTSDESNPLFSVEAYQSIKLVLQEISNAVVALGGV